MLVIAFSWLATAAANEISLPTIGTEANTAFSPDEEHALGSAMLRQLRQYSAITEDPEVEDYIWNLGYRLVSNSDYKSKPFYFFVINDTAINAFAGPGGYIGVHTGLITASESEDEVAGVLAHEISHVTQRHLDRAFSASNKLGIPTAAAIIAALVLGAKDVNIAEAAIAATLAANIQTQLNFTRTHEEEADRIGIQILAQSQFDPNAMPSFFERLQSNERMYSAQVPEFLRTHPVTTNRIAESKSRAAQFRYEAPKDKDDIIYRLIKAKLTVMAQQNPLVAVKKYEAEITNKNAQDRRASLYGYAYALMRANKTVEAEKNLELLISEDRERIPYFLLKAQITFAQGKNDQTKKIYEEALNLHPHNRALTQSYANALLLMGDAPYAKAILSPLLKDRPSPVVFELLAKAEGETDNPGAALQMMAEYYFLHGQTRTAIDQLTLALRQKDISAWEANRIEGRLKELKEIALMEQQLPR